LTYNAPVTGEYRISWYAELNDPETGFFSNRTCLARVQLNNTTDLGQVEVGSDRDVWFPFGGFARVNLTAGSNTIDMDYASNETATVSIRRARIEVWRV
jgi:hypothetical protein